MEMEYKMKMPMEKFRAAVQKYVFEQVIPKADGDGLRSGFWGRRRL